MEAAERMSVSLRDEGDWDAPGALSIVLQGGLFPGNLVETANNAAHWRALFPRSQIILAVSVTDVLAPAGGEPAQFRLAGAHRDNGLFRAALRALQAACDHIRLAEVALPFPPLKWDGHGANNINLQIAAARSGLAVATGRHVLRVRSDLVFLDRRFLAQYAERTRFRRGEAAVFRDRVLVSWLYTLNPYTLERMPFHVSDWFHFGLTDDVRRIWQVPPMTLADALHHKVHRYPPEANQLERLIVPRIAVEQHIIYHCFKAAWPELSLETMVDWRSRALSVDVLADNFVVCDLAAAGCVFDKYAFDFENVARFDHCVTRDDWMRMAALSGTERQAVLADKVGIRARPEIRPFPRHWPAASLRTKQGSRSGGDIIAMPTGGVLTHGPYDSVPSGRYLAVLQTSICRGPGTVTLRITLGEGLRVLAERRMALDADVEGRLEVPFDLLSGIGSDLELVTEVEGAPRLVVTGLTIEERPDIGYVETERFGATVAPMLHRFGKAGPAGVETEGRGGHLLFGPSITLPAGDYRARFDLTDVADPGGAKIEVATEVRHSASQQVVAVADVTTGVRECPFELDNETHRVEFRVWVTTGSVLTVREVVLERR